MLRSNPIRIMLPEEIPKKIYYSLYLDFPIELPYVDQELWLTRSQMALIYSTTEHRISKLFSKILRGLHKSEVEFTRYVQTIKYQDRKFIDKFFRIDLALLAGHFINSNGYQNFKSWTNISLDY